MAKQAKKVAKKAAKKMQTQPSGIKPLMVPVDSTLHAEFSNFRAKRQTNRQFPWTVRDCMDAALRDYLNNQGS